MSLEQLRERVSIGINGAFREEVSLEMQRRSTFMGGIEQAKVLRGPSTAQHDSASLGRVLQVISRSPDKLAPRPRMDALLFQCLTQLRQRLIFIA